MCVLTRSLLELLTKNYKNMYLICFYLLHSYNPSFLIYVCFNKVSFRGQKKLGHAQIGLLEGFNSKFPTSIPTPFICRVPPPGIFTYFYINLFMHSGQCLFNTSFHNYSTRSKLNIRRSSASTLLQILFGTPWDIS